MAFATRAATAGIVCTVALLGVAPASLAAEPSSASPCSAAQSAFNRGELDKARDAYLELMDGTPPTCAIGGLVAVVKAKHREALFCARGAEFAKAKRDDDAVRQYAAALDENIASECAKKGIAPPESGKSLDGRFVDYLPQFPVHLGSVLLMGLGIVLLGLVVFSLLRWLFLGRRASLVVRPFVDSAVGPKVGAAFGALIEEKLIGVRQRERLVRDDGYNLDLVVANVELFSEEEALSDAVGAIAQVPQLQLIAAVLSFIDMFINSFKRRLAAAGELLPAGANGSGVALALYNRKSLRARGALWEDTIATLSAPAQPAGVPAAPPGGPSAPVDATPYYALAGPAAAWVQYEAARILDTRVTVITSSAESFSLLSRGLAHHRAGERLDAAEKYAEALAVDPNNIAALVNLALLLARFNRAFIDVSLLLLKRAQVALADRYAERQ